MITMKRILICCLVTTLSQAAPDTNPATNPPPPIVQPGIPGPWESLTPQPLSPLADVLQRPGPGRLIYGLYAWPGEYLKHRQSIREVGWPSIRIAGPFDDKIMRALADDDANVMVTLESRLLDPARGKDRSGYASDEEFLTDAKQKMLAFLDRYGPGGRFFTENAGVPVRPVREIEIWNEPNFQYLIPPDGRPQDEQESAREKLYVRLLRSVCPVIRKEHPGVTVAGFAGGGMSAGDLRFVQGALAANAGLSSDFDVLSTHPYVRPAPPEANLIEKWGSYSIARSIATIRETLAKDGSPDKRIWMTEIGWPVSQADGGFFPTPPGKSFVTPLLQAAYVCRTYALALRLGVERVHVMFAVDTDNFNGGFFLKDGSWRLSAHAVRTMIHQLPDPKLTGAISDGKNGFFAYTFAPGANPPPPNDTIMAWNVNGPLAVQIPVPTANVRVVDMLGHETGHAAKDGKITLTVGPCPIYVTPVADATRAGGNPDGMGK